jgi:hypothetical protein
MTMYCAFARRSAASISNVSWGGSSSGSISPAVWGIAYRGLDLPEPVCEEGDESIADRSGLGVHLGQRGGKETASGERLAFEVGEVALYERVQAIEWGRGV